MTVFIDPVCYFFCFTCLSQEENEPLIKESFKRIIRPCEEDILDFLSTGGPKEYRISVDSINHGALGNQMYWIGDGFRPRSQTVSSWNKLFERLEDKSFFGFQMWSHAREDMLLHTCGSTKFGREYYKWFGVHRGGISREAFETNIGTIHALLNFPANDLRPVSIPISMLNRNRFGIMMYRMPVTETENRPYQYTVKASPDCQDLGFLYQIKLVLPRFIMTEHTDIPSMQRIWTDTLIHLGNNYPAAIGGIDMDCPPDFSYNNCYEQAAIDKLKTRYFDECISGYSWGMLLSASQAKMLRGLSDSIKQKFYLLKEMENGCSYFQVTSDMRDVSKEDCTFLRSVIRPYLPPVPLEPMRNLPPPSMRMGLSMNEIEFCDNNMFACRIVVK